MLKGVGMLTIVFAHTGELYPMGDASHINPLTFFHVRLPRIPDGGLFTLPAATVSAAPSASASSSSSERCSSLTSIRHCHHVFHFIIHYSLFHYFPTPPTRPSKVAGRLSLGLPHTTTYAGQQFFSTGPMWYLLSLLIGWVLLDAILNIFPRGSPTAYPGHVASWSPLHQAIGAGSGPVEHLLRCRHRGAHGPLPGSP